MSSLQPTSESVTVKATALPVLTNGAAELALYDAACRAVAAAIAVDEVQDIRAQADAMRAYAKQSKNRQLEINAAEIRIRAERRLGELMEAQKETVGFSEGGRPAKTGLRSNPVSKSSAGLIATRTQESPATLAEAGIDKNLAHRARTLAAMPDEKFEEALSKKRERDSVRVLLDDPDFQAAAKEAQREAEEERQSKLEDLRIARDERIVMAGAEALYDENEKLLAKIDALNKQTGTLDRRINALMSENNSLKYRVEMWRKNAIAAGWKGRPDA